MITVPKLLILLAIIIVVFGTRKLRNVGEDLGNAIKSFRNAIRDGEEDGKKPAEDDKVIDADAVNKTTDNDKV